MFSVSRVCTIYLPKYCHQTVEIKTPFQLNKKMTLQWWLETVFDHRDETNPHTVLRFVERQIIFQNKNDCNMPIDKMEKAEIASPHSFKLLINKIKPNFQDWKSTAGIYVYIKKIFHSSLIPFFFFLVLGSISKKRQPTKCDKGRVFLSRWVVRSLWPHHWSSLPNCKI
jgi:hypothetical protein